jgi:hypothetical protein
VLDRLNPGLSDATQATQWGLPFAVLGFGALLVPVSIAALRLRGKRNGAAP